MSKWRQKDEHECHICKKKMRYDYLVNFHFPNMHKRKYSQPLIRGQQTLCFSHAASSSSSLGRLPQHEAQATSGPLPKREGQATSGPLPQREDQATSDPLCQRED